MEGMGQNTPKEIPIQGDECVALLAQMKFSRFRIKDQSEYTFIKYVCQTFDMANIVKKREEGLFVRFFFYL